MFAYSLHSSYITSATPSSPFTCIKHRLSADKLGQWAYLVSAWAWGRSEGKTRVGTCTRRDVSSSSAAYPLPPRKRGTGHQIYARSRHEPTPNYMLPLGWETWKEADSCAAAQESTVTPSLTHTYTQAHTHTPALARCKFDSDTEEAVSSSDVACHFWSI